MLERRILTNHIIGKVQLIGNPVGDAWAPTVPYGWTDTAKSPNSQFIPYVIIIPAATSEISGSLAMPDSDVWFPYQISGFGSTREQCEWVMDSVRKSIDSMQGHVIEGGWHPDASWTISFVDTRTIGGIVRGGPEDQPIFGQTDTITLFMSENLGHN